LAFYWLLQFLTAKLSVDRAIVLVEFAPFRVFIKTRRIANDSTSKYNSVTNNLTYSVKADNFRLFLVTFNSALLLNSTNL
jgi:hypothetical protein